MSRSGSGGSAPKEQVTLDYPARLCTRVTIFSEGPSRRTAVQIVRDGAGRGRLPRTRRVLGARRGQGVASCKAAARSARRDGPTSVQRPHGGREPTGPVRRNAGAVPSA